MNGVESSRQMAKNRDLFRETIKKNNEANEKRLSDLKNQHEYIQNKQLDTFTSDKNKMEKSYQTQLNDLSDKTRNTLDSNQKDYEDKITAEREQFAKSTEDQRKDFDTRLKDIKYNYNKSLTSENDRNQEVENSQKKHFDNTISENRNDSHEKMKAFEKKMLGSGSDLKLQYNKERRQISDAYDENLKNILKDGVEKRDELKDRLTWDMKQTKEVAAADLERTRKHSENRINTIENDYQDRFRNMAFEYAQKNDDVVRKQKEDSRKQTKIEQENLLNVQRNSDRKLKDIELERRRREIGNGEFAEIMKDQKGFNDRIRYEKQIKNLRNNLEEVEKRFVEKSDKERNSFTRELKSQKQDASSNIERKQLDANIEKNSTIAKEREKNVKDYENLQYINKLEKINSDKQLISEREDSTEKIKKVQENFSKSIKEIEDKNKTQFETMTKESQKDKSEFMKTIQMARSEEIFALKRDFSKVMETTVQDYEKKIEDLKRKNDVIKLTLEKRADALVDQSEKKLEMERRMFEERKVADSKAMLNLQDKRDFEYKKKLSAINDSHQKKMDKMQISHDNELKMITNEYENKLKAVQIDQLKTVTEKDASHRIELDRLKQAYESDRYSTITSYENQIAEMRKSYQDQIKQLKEYNKLS